MLQHSLKSLFSGKGFKKCSFCKIQNAMLAQYASNNFLTTTQKYNYRTNFINESNNNNINEYGEAKKTLIKEGLKISSLNNKKEISYPERRRRRLLAMEKIRREKNSDLPSLEEEIYQKRPVVEFPNRYFALFLPSVINKTSKVVFHVPMDYTKPEIKEYLETYYGLKIKDVNTMIYRGKLKRSRKVRGKQVKEPDYKKAIITLFEPVDLNFSDEVKLEIARSYDKRLNAKIKEAREAAEKLKGQQGEPGQEGMNEDQMKELEEAHRQMQQQEQKQTVDAEVNEKK
ncbi:hypothetical protein ABK040_001067 [Willaertia magna]